MSPGAAATNFGQDGDKGFFINMVFKIALFVMDKPEKGAMTSIYLASSADVEGVTGQFFGNRKKLKRQAINTGRKKTNKKFGIIVKL